MTPLPLPPVVLPTGWMAQTALSSAAIFSVFAAAAFWRVRARVLALMVVVYGVMAAVCAYGISQRWPGW